MSERAEIPSSPNRSQDLLERLQDLRQWHLLYCRKIRHLLDQKYAIECGEANVLGEIRDTLGEERLYQVAMQADLYPDYVNYLLHMGLSPNEPD